MVWLRRVLAGWQSHAPLQSYLVDALMEHMGMDVLGLFSHTKVGNHYVFMAQGILFPNQSTTTTAAKLLEELFCRFRGPRDAAQDKGRNIKLLVFGKVYKWLGIMNIHTTTQHTQSGRLVEWFHCTLATQLVIVFAEH